MPLNLWVLLADQLDPVTDGRNAARLKAWTGAAAWVGVLAEARHSDPGS